MKTRRGILQKISDLLILVLVAVVMIPSSATALSPEQKRVIDSGIGYFDVAELDCDLFGTTTGAGAGSGQTLPNTIPPVWRDLIAAAAPQYPDVDARLVASVLWAENRGWPAYDTQWRTSSASAQGPWQFIPSTWASMGTDGDGDGIADPNNPADAVHAAFKHHAGSAGKPLAVQGYNAGANADANFQTTVFERTATNLLFYAAKYNGSGAPNGIRLNAFPRRENADYVIMNYWLLATNFDRGWSPETGQLLDAKNKGTLFGLTNPDDLVVPGGGTNLTGNPLCPTPAAAGSVVGDMAWPMPKSFYDADPENWTDTHHDYPAVDIGVPTGTPVYAMIAGRIINAPTGGRCGQGVSIDSGNIIMVYCHGVDGGRVRGAAEGDQVRPGQLIMHAGSTGNSSGPHLHLGIRVNGQQRCPQTLFPALAAGSPIAIESLPSSGCVH